MSKTKIAILGGGVGALSAAFDLTEVDPHGDLYDITVYQLGWRLGGKAAVGWTCNTYPTPGFVKQRVQLEHGLHIWAGFYDNAFDLVKRLYAANDGLRGRDFLEHFAPTNRCWLMDDLTGAYRPWPVNTRRNRRTPGLSRFPPTPGAMWRQLLRLTSTATRNRDLNAYLEAAHAREPFVQTAKQASFARKAAAMVEQGARGAGLHPGDRRRALALTDFATNRMSETLFSDGRLRAGALSPDTLRIAIMINIGFALTLGMLDRRVPLYGFDQLDGAEMSEWVLSYGAWRISVESALVRGFYDYAFGYDPHNQGNIAAGTATRTLLRLVLAYKGALFWRLKVTMGEFLLAPLYETLKQRHVKFEFFSRVDKLHLSADKKNIDKIDIGVQAKLKGADYDPLIDMPHGGKSWPARPNYEQLVHGDEMYANLELKGQDLETPWNAWGVVDSTTLDRAQGHFDKVILGISLGALGSICEELASEGALKWKAMLDEVKTCPTVATQLWTSKTPHDYVWSDGFHWPAQGATVTSFAQPLNTWGDNSQLLDLEAWDGCNPSQAVAYFVGNLFPVAPLPPVNKPSDFPVHQLQRASDDVDHWIDTELPKLWPGFTRADLTHDPWVRVNVAPSDRYVQSVKGSVEKRLAPDGSGIDNLYLAGDWVRIAYNAGCIEQAVIGGRAAARAITGVDMNSPYDRDRSNWDGEQPMSPSLTALLSNLPDLSRIAYAGVGVIDARCIIASVETAAVKALLPPGLSFNLGKFEPAQLPLVLLFSEQKRVRPAFAPFGGINYLEVAIVLTGVYSCDPTDDYGGPYIYSPRLFLNSLGPTAIGATLYGFRKELARIARVGDSFLVRNSLGEISAKFENASLLGQIRDFQNNQRLRSFLDLPIISETTQGGYVWSYIDYHFDTASFQTLTGQCAFHQGGLKQDTFEIKAGPGPWSEDAEPQLILEAFGVRMVSNWSITLPVRLGEYDGLLSTPARQHAVATTRRIMDRLRGRR